MTFRRDRDSQEATSDYSGSGEPTLVEWSRRPYDTYSYPPQRGNEGGGNINIVGGVSNPLANQDPLPPSSPTHQVSDLEFEPKLSSTYQSLTELQRAGTNTNYADLARKRMGGDRHKSASSCARCSEYFFRFVAVLALLLACGGIALAGYTLFMQDPPQEDRITTLETQLSAANLMIDQLSTKLTELQNNVSNANGTSIQELSLQVNQIYDSVSGILKMQNTTVDLSEGCEYVFETCSIETDLVTEVQDANPDTYPNFASCFTSQMSLTLGETYVQDVYCAVSDPRSERNPQMATLRHDEGTNTVSCFCFVTGIERRRSVVDCSLIVRRCPVIVEVN